MMFSETTTIGFCRACLYPSNLLFLPAQLIVFTHPTHCLQKRSLLIPCQNTSSFVMHVNFRMLRLELVLPKSLCACLDPTISRLQYLLRATLGSMAMLHVLPSKNEGIDVSMLAEGRGQRRGSKPRWTNTQVPGFVRPHVLN